MSVEPNNNLTQWKKRVKLVKFIYNLLIKNLNKEQAIYESINHFNLDVNQIKMVEYVIDNFSLIKNEINNYTSSTWTFDRLNYVDQAILIQSFAEHKINKTEKNIIIDQAIITSKKYSDKDNYKYINAILDKLIIN